MSRTMSDDTTDKALCPRCGNEEFTIEARIGIKAVCTECDWSIDPDNFEEAVNTPQDHNGNTLTR